MHKTRLNTNTAASWNTESILAFNYNVFNDFMLVDFLRELMESQPDKSNVIRAIFKGKKDVSLTMVDRYVNTPFRCQMLAHFCKQLQEELDFTYKSVNVMLTPIKEKIDSRKYGVSIADDFKRDGPIKCACLIPPNNNFEYTIHRDMYFKACTDYELEAQNRANELTIAGQLTPEFLQRVTLPKIKGALKLIYEMKSKQDAIYSKLIGL